jgi:fibrillarin-like pre-rRNA processing protein
MISLLSAEEIFEGVYRVPDPRNPEKKLIATCNLTPGRTYYGEQVIKTREGEFRAWDPFRSKLSAAILNGIKFLPFRAGVVCLYLGASTGTTVSHISDIVGETGKIFAVEMASRVAREFVEKVAKYRKNVTSIIADARQPERYQSIYGTVSIVYCDIAQPDQTEIAIANCKRFFAGGSESILFLVVKASSIDALKNKRLVFEEQIRILKVGGFATLEKIDLEPYDRNHAMIVARAAH